MGKTKKEKQRLSGEEWERILCEMMLQSGVWETGMDLIQILKKGSSIGEEEVCDGRQTWGPERRKRFDRMLRELTQEAEKDEAVLDAKKKPQAKWDCNLKVKRQNQWSGAQEEEDEVEAVVRLRKEGEWVKAEKVTLVGEGKKGKKEKVGMKEKRKD